MGTSIKPLWTETLPEPLPANPLEIVVQWLAEAQAGAAQPNPNAMVLATVNEHGQPSARVVLCKGIVPEGGYIVFYTNYQSHKGRDLESNPRAAVVFHWDHQHRQVRAEGRVERLSDADNDAYFGSRPWQSRLGAWASRQSAPIESRIAMEESVAAEARRFGIPYGGPGTPEPETVRAKVPRPPHWGGFRLNVDALELWVEGEFRIHDRARWTRGAGGTTPGPGSRPGSGTATWTVTRLQP
jgi:pyridoxamine 5'-phosphate oxidase